MILQSVHSSVTVQTQNVNGDKDQDCVLVFHCALNSSTHKN